MDGLGRVGFDRFVILWPKPNSTRYKKKFVTQHNPPNSKNRPNPSVWVKFDGSVSFLHTPNKKCLLLIYNCPYKLIISLIIIIPDDKDCF